MGDVTQVCAATTAVASFTAGYTAVQSPLSALDFRALGVEDHVDAVSRLATPCEIAEFTPTGAAGWDRLEQVVDKILSELELRHLLTILELHAVTTNTIATNPLAFFQALVKNLAEYFVEEITGILTLLWELVKLLAEVAQCRATFWRATAAEFVQAVFSGEFEPLVILGTLEQECELFRELVAAVGTVQQLWADITALGFEGLVDHAGEFLASFVEMLRDGDLQRKALEMATDPQKLGGFYGTLYGFILWEVLETLLSGPLGKVGKAVKVTLT